MVVVRLIQPVGAYTARGQVTGREYHWSGSGSTVVVDDTDAPELLARRVRRGCCGSPPRELPIFAMTAGGK